MNTIVNREDALKKIEKLKSELNTLQVTVERLEREDGYPPIGAFVLIRDGEDSACRVYYRYAGKGLFSYGTCGTLRYVKPTCWSYPLAVWESAPDYAKSFVHLSSGVSAFSRKVPRVGDSRGDGTHVVWVEKRPHDVKGRKS